jgi:hypothetical protein
MTPGARSSGSFVGYWVIMARKSPQSAAISCSYVCLGGWTNQRHRAIFTSEATNRKEATQMYDFEALSGTRDADFETRSLVEAGNRHAKLVKRFGTEGLAKLQAGETISQRCHSKVTDKDYVALVRMDDGETLYSIDGAQWFTSSREAYAATL